MAEDFEALYKQAQETISEQETQIQNLTEQAQLLTDKNEELENMNRDLMSSLDELIQMCKEQQELLNSLSVE